MLKEEFRRKIQLIPNPVEGFWCSEAEDAYLEMANMLIRMGISQEDVIDKMTKLYWATSREFGL